MPPTPLPPPRGTEEGLIVPAGGVHELPANEVLIEGGITQDAGAGVHGRLQREKGTTAVGVEGGISQKKGWSLAGFFKKAWK